MSTNLREADAIVSAEGILQEKTLKIEYDNGVPYISGNITIKIDDINTITFNARQSSKTKKGEPNKVYNGLVTVMNDYKSIAEVGEENADRIRINNGQLRPAYMVRSAREGIFYQANFYNRVNGDEALTPHAEFEVELYIDSVIPEQYTTGDKAGEETGRAIVHGWLPTYSGIEPVDLIATADIAGDIADLYTKGTTGRFYGNIINSRIEKKTVTPVRIGKPKETTSVTYTNELVITGATEPYTEDSNKTFDKEAVQLAKQERESRIEEKKATAGSTASANGNWQQKAPDSGRKLPF